MGPCLFFFIKSSQNIPEILRLEYHEHFELFVYDLRFLSMSVMGFQTKVWIGGVMGECCELTQFFFICLTLQSPLHNLPYIQTRS